MLTPDATAALGARRPVHSTRIDGCRSCGSAGLAPVLDLGPVPLANRLLRREELELPEPRVPLELVVCSTCGLAQINETVDPAVLFRQYPYCSSFSDEVLEHSRRHVEDLLRTRRLGPESLVLEIASNDGYLLQYFVAAGVPVLGVEPALNVAEIARQRGVPTRMDFFDRGCAEALRRDGFVPDVILGNNVLAHVADLGGFVDGVSTLLGPKAIAHFEFPYVRNLVEDVQFDTIYHEHLCYFSGHALEHLFARHGLVFTDVQRVPIHGGSLRATVARAPIAGGRQRVEALLQEERRCGMCEVAYYRQLTARVERLKNDLLALLGELKRDGCRLAAYGASAKGAVLTNSFGIGRDLLEYVVDRSTVKQGWYTAGTHLEIRPTSTLVEDRPDYALMLAWNFASEIIAQQSEYLERGGHFIVPIPDVRIV